MAPENVTTRTLLAIVVVVGLGLLAWNIRLPGSDGTPAPPAGEGAVTVTGLGPLAEVQSPPTADARARAAEEDAVPALLEALRRGGTEERRNAALMLQYQADARAEPDLLRALRDPDAKVAQRSAKALVSLWQHSDSPALNRVFSEGLTAWRVGNCAEAREIFESFHGVGKSVPDVYRLRADVYLALATAAEGPQGGELLDRALDDCRMALTVKDINFWAYYVQARCYIEKKDGPAALESVNNALRIYPGFQEAYQLKMVIRSKQQAGEL